VHEKGRESGLFYTRAIPAKEEVVIPAKAGIQWLFLQLRNYKSQRRWIPAFAGMTT